MLMIPLVVLLCSPQEVVAPPKPAPPVIVALTSAPADVAGGPRWSPKAASVPLTADAQRWCGRFSLGPSGTASIALALEKSAGSERFDRLWVDADRDGVPTASELLTCTPNLQRGKWWSSFQTALTIEVPAASDSPSTQRPYPLSLWYVEDPLAPDAPPALRWTRRGWHEGQTSIGGSEAWVLVTEMTLDGVFDQRDRWFLARSRDALFGTGARALDQHVWLDGRAYRALDIDPHGRHLAIESFDPGITQEEEAARADLRKPDRDAVRAPTPLAFLTSLTVAMERASAEKKLILVDFQTTWCGPCREMEHLVFTAAAVVDASRGVVAVKLDGDEQRDLVKQYAVTAYPTLLLLDATGKELRRAVGYRGVAAMTKFLSDPVQPD